MFLKREKSSFVALVWEMGVFVPSDIFPAERVFIVSCLVKNYKIHMYVTYGFFLCFRIFRNLEGVLLLFLFRIFG